MKNWVKNSVVYQIYPKSFYDSNGDGIGDLQGIIEKLDYFTYLGINVIWLCPIYKSGGVDGGYDIADYKAIENQFGTIEDFDELLAQAHKRDIRVIMDLVVNHTSDKHEFFIESRKSINNEKHDWYIWKDGKDYKEPSSINSVFSGSAWEYDDDCKQYYLHLFAKGQPDLNWENEKVRDYVYTTIKWWMDKGIDGFRMDVITVLSKPDFIYTKGGSFEDCANNPKLHNYLKEMNKKVISKYDVMTVGEAPCTNIEEAKALVAQDRDELDMIFNFDHITTEDNEYGKWNKNRYSMPKIREILASWQKGLEEKGWNSLFWGNHDQPRLASRFGDDSTKFLLEKSSKMLATCLYCMKGTPYIFQGDEIGMTNVPISSLEECRDIESINAYNEFVNEKKIYDDSYMMDCIALKGRDNARTPIQWNSSLNAGFSKGKPWIKINPNYLDLNIENQIQDKQSILQYYRKLISLKKDLPVLIDGTFDLLDENNDDLFTYKRTLNNHEIIVMCNYNKESISIPSSLIKQINLGELILSNFETNLEDKLQSYESRVYLM